MLEAIALLFRISEEDRKVMLSSGNQAVFDKRGGWVKTYLRKAGLPDFLPPPISFITHPHRNTLSSHPNKRSFR